MGTRAAGAIRLGWVVGAVAGLSGAAACDSGEGTPLGVAGTSTAGGTPPGASGSATGGSATSGSATGGSATAGSGAGGSGAGGGGAGGSSAGTGGSAMSGGDANVGGADGGVGNDGGASEGGAGGESGGAGGSGMGGNAGIGGVSLGGNGGSVGCQTAQVTFAPLASNVLLLVDGSGTMFTGTGATVWDRVRDALLPTIDAVDGQLSIGFLSMSAEQNACPAFQEVAPAKNNYTAIAAKYSAIAKPTKGESPFPLALDRAAQLLNGKPGDKHIIFIIDGEPDYCNDGQPDCAIDSTVWRLQKLKTAGVTTHVAALPFPLPPLSGDVSATRQSYANAGAGLPVSTFGGTESYVYYACYSQPKWAEDHTATGKGAETLIGTYSSTPGAAPFSALDSNAAGELQASFQQVFAKTQSCSFELTGGAKIVLDRASTGVVKLDGQTVPFHATSGWSMESQTVLKFSGAACTQLHASVSAQLSFQFPCSAIAN